jgi:hypothetical protein
MMLSSISVLLSSLSLRCYRRPSLFGQNRRRASSTGGFVVEEEGFMARLSRRIRGYTSLSDRGSSDIEMMPTRTSLEHV